MSDGSQLKLRQLRPIDSKERDLVPALLDGVFPAVKTEQDLSHTRVQDMADGGMGSILFASSDPEPRHFGKVVAEAEYIDQDGVPVSITVNLDSKGDLFEVDFWKVDFTPLLRYPGPEDLRHRTAATLSEPAIASRS